jgi:alpha-beta hydrolase superfamily lysophospholipase
MGGAVILWILLLFPETIWNGVILVAPMCKISEEMTPHWLVVKTLTALSNQIPKWPIVPAPDVLPLVFKDAASLEMARSNPLTYPLGHRVKTAVQLLRATQFIETRMESINAPMLILQGEDDRVTDPKTCKELYERISSTDKTFHLYPGVCHAVLEESQEITKEIWAEMNKWTDDRLQTPSPTQAITLN